MRDDIKKNADQKMHKSIENYKNTLAKIRTGRAHAGILDHVMIDCYGSIMPINQVATVMVSDSRTLTIQPYDIKMAGSIEKAIRESDLGLNPASNGSTIRVPMPMLTEERRKELIKVVKSESENAKISLRNIRRDANSELKTLLKNKEISEDEDKRTQDAIQKITDIHTLEIDKLTEIKEKDLLTV